MIAFQIWIYFNLNILNDLYSMFWHYLLSLNAFWSNNLICILSEQIPDIVVFVLVSLQTSDDFLEVLGIVIDNLELLLGICVPLFEVVIVFWFIFLIDLHGMPQDGFLATLVVLSVETLLFDVINGHQNLSEFGHPTQLLGLYLLGLRTQLNMLDLDLVKKLVVFGNVVVQL